MVASLPSSWKLITFVIKIEGSRLNRCHANKICRKMNDDKTSNLPMIYTNAISSNAIKKIL